MNTERQKKEIEFLRNKWTENLEVYDIDTDYISGKLSVSPVLSPDFKLRCTDYNRDVAHLLITVNDLPPIELLFQLNNGYPSTDMPNYQISCLWLTYDQMRQLCRKLNRLWQTNSGAVILDVWATFLKEETMTFLGIDNLIDLTEELEGEYQTKKKMKNSNMRQNKGFGRHRVLMIKLNVALSQYLVKYNKNRKLKQFLSSPHTCSKCRQVVTGSRTIVFKICKHEVCFACISLLVITVIPLLNLFYICPVPDCEKTISKHKVWSFIEDVAADRAYEPKEIGPFPVKRKFEGEKDEQDEEEVPKKLVECPGCKGSVGVYSADDTLAICTACVNIFCHLCKKTYHGLQPCHINPDDKLKIFLGYTTASEEEKTNYINKYGLQRLSRLVLQLNGGSTSQRDQGTAKVD